MNRIFIFFCMLLLPTCFFSCQEKDALVSTEGNPVMLNLHFSFQGMERDISRSMACTKAYPTDPETGSQRALDVGDIYVLVFQHDILIEQVEKIELSTLKENPLSNSYYATLTGSFPLPKDMNDVRLVVFANLRQNSVTHNDAEKTSISLDGKGLFTSYKGKTESELYDDLIFSYPITGVPESSGGNINRIPMWGKTDRIPLNDKGMIVASGCVLHRAVAKLGFTINGGKGYYIAGKEPSTNDDYNFKITTIDIKESNRWGCCAPGKDAILKDNYFSSPHIPLPAPDLNELKTIQPSTNGITNEWLNGIYLHETKEKQVVIYIRYLVKQSNEKWTDIAPPKNYVRDYPADPTKYLTVPLEESIIRNYSHIINLIKETPKGTELTYEVIPWEGEHGGSMEFN